jgi:hypothetical protein
MIDSGMLNEADAHLVPSNVILQVLGVGTLVEPSLTYHELRQAGY